MKKASIVMGRFEPFHNGHLYLFDQATKDCDLLIVVLGSAGRPADIKNPFTDNDRAAMITGVFHTEKIFRDRNFLTKFVSVHDYRGSDSDTPWIQEVRSKVVPEVEEYEVTLFGHRSDHSSYYLDLFPDWPLKETEQLESAWHATEIREQLFKYKKIPENTMPRSIERFIRQWMESHAYVRLRAEWNLINKQKQQWSKAPYTVSFATADAVVLHKGRVLMVKRGAHPGKGLMALPGGYLQIGTKTKAGDKDLLKTAIRECEEETGLELKRSECRTPAKQPFVFAHPERSVRGRIITHVYLWVLEGDDPLEVQGGDDADEAFWIPLDEIYRSSHLIFEDHLEIITAVAATA